LAWSTWPKGCCCRGTILTREIITNDQ
jgi:hypothetical protein